jgi:hypothetical protein
MRSAVVAALVGCAATGSGIAVGAARAPTAQTPPAPAPPVVPQHGRSFTPAQGNWEGVTRGYAASFQLGFDPASGRYVLTRLVLLRPNACPADPARYSEFFLRGPAAVPLGPTGSLRFGSADVHATLTGAGAAMLTSTYRVGACTGTLTWHMRPAHRAAVQDGVWTIRFGGGPPARFSVGSGGRLARAIPLPAIPAGCSGLRGAVDLFISASGRATFSQTGVSLSMRFARRTATGTLHVAGCRAGSLRISASAPR